MKGSEGRNCGLWTLCRGVLAAACLATVLGAVAAAPATKTTAIAIDGNPQDWASYPVLIRDAVGDNQGGGFDISDVRAFTNDAYLYLLIETNGARKDYVQVPIDVQAGARHLRLIIRPEEGGPAELAEISAEGEFTDLGSVENSVCCAAAVVELKVPLAALDGVQNLTLLDVRPMAGEPGEPSWHAVDHAGPAEIPHLSEVEPSLASGSGPEEPKTLLTSVPTSGSATTEITVDGSADDWTNRTPVAEGPAGDSEPGALDFTTQYALLNHDALYLLGKVVDPSASFQQFAITLQVDSKQLLVAWRPGHQAGYILDTTGEAIDVGDTQYSSFAFGPCLEVRLDLRDLGSPTAVGIVGVQTMVGICCDYPAWRAADQWQAATILAVSESDPARLISNEEMYVLARQFGLPDDYVAARIFAPPAPNLVGVASSKNGTVYLIYGGLGLSAGIVTVDPASGKVTPVLDLPISNGYYAAAVGGPEGTAFVPVGGEIWQVWPDGTHQVWSSPPGGARPKFLLANGRLLACSSDGRRVLELASDGTVREIATGFSGIYDIVAVDDGTVFVTDPGTGDITRIDTDGSKHLLVAHVLLGDPMDLGVGPDGDVYMMTVVTGFVKVDRRTGQFTRYDSALCSCTPHQMDFAFHGGRVLFVDPAFSQVTWADLRAGTNGLLVSSGGANTWAAAIGPDGALYVGTWGCQPTLPAQVVRIGDDGSRRVYVDGLQGAIWSIAFATDGGLYIATDNGTRTSPTLYVAPNGGTARKIPGAECLTSLSVDPITGHLFGKRGGSSSVFEFSTTRLIAEHAIRLPKPVADLRIAFAPDGTLYAYASESERASTGPTVNRWLLRLNVASGSCETVFQFDYQGCCVMGNICVDAQGITWLLVDPEKVIYRVTPNGDAALLARNLPIDPAAVAVDARGDVYFTSAGGIYRIFKGS